MISRKLNILRKDILQHKTVALPFEQDNIFNQCNDLLPAYLQTYGAQYAQVFFWNLPASPLLARCRQILPAAQDVNSNKQMLLELLHYSAKRGKKLPGLLICGNYMQDKVQITQKINGFHILFCNFSSDLTFAHRNRQVVWQATGQYVRQSWRWEKRWHQLSAAAQQLLSLCTWWGGQEVPYLSLFQVQDAKHRAHYLNCAAELRAAGFSCPAPAGIVELVPSVLAWQHRRHQHRRQSEDGNQLSLACALLMQQLAETDIAPPLLKQLTRLAENLLPHLAHDTSLCIHLLQQLERHNQDDLPQAEELLTRILILQKKAGRRMQIILSHNLLAQNVKRQGRMGEAQEHLLQALQLCQQGLNTESGSMYQHMHGICLSNLARLFAARGQHLAACDLELQALDLLRANLGQSDPQVLTVMQNLAHSLLHLPANESTEATLTILLEEHLQIFGDSDQRSQQLMNQLAGNLQQQHKLAQAQQWSARLLTARRQSFGPHHSDTSVAAYELMCLHLELEQTPQALLVFDNYLHWLAQTPVLRLSEEQGRIRQALMEVAPLQQRVHQPQADQHLRLH